MATPRLKAFMGAEIAFSSIPALILDRLGVRIGEYTVRSRGGTRFFLRAGTSDRFTLYETLMRGDYFSRYHPKPGDTVVDIGANIGIFSILAARRVAPGGRVVAIEPNPVIAERLQRNLTLNRIENVRVHRVAVAGKSGTMKLHTGGKDIFASLLPAVDGRTLIGEATTVPCETLAALLEKEGIARVDLLKIDCEGGEYEIFDTAPSDLWQKLPRIAMETHRIDGRDPLELKDKLESVGYVTWEDKVLYAVRQ